MWTKNDPHALLNQSHLGRHLRKMAPAYEYQQRIIIVDQAIPDVVYVITDLIGFRVNQCISIIAIGTF